MIRRDSETEGIIAYNIEETESLRKFRRQRRRRIIVALAKNLVKRIDDSLQDEQRSSAVKEYRRHKEEWQGNDGS